jgi:hypothetical protein
MEGSNPVCRLSGEVCTRIETNATKRYKRAHINSSHSWMFTGVLGHVDKVNACVDERHGSFHYSIGGASKRDDRSMVIVVGFNS